MELPHVCSASESTDERMSTSICLKKSQSLTPGNNLSQVFVNSSARTARTSTPHMGEASCLIACSLACLSLGQIDSVNKSERLIPEKKIKIRRL